MTTDTKTKLDKLLLTYDEAAFVLGVSKKTVQNKASAGEIKVVRPGPLIVRIPMTEIHAYIARLLAVEEAA